ncbi:MAG: hypothetical protein F6K55_14905 [Moorea sp. SIO4A3]|nr:hypothetical protein [Moorena sp. SIO4A3]
MAFGHATRTTFNLGLWPRYANNLQPWPLATLREQPSTDHAACRDNNS